MEQVSNLEPRASEEHAQSPPPAPPGHWYLEKKNRILNFILKEACDKSQKSTMLLLQLYQVHIEEHLFPLESLFSDGRRDVCQLFSFRGVGVRGNMGFKHPSPWPVNMI